MAKCCKSVAKFIPAVVAWTLLVSATTLFFYYVKYHFSVVFVQAIITMFVVTNFFLATLMDPGVIPKAGPDEDNDDDFRAPLYKTVEINGTPVRMKWCVTCQFYRPPRCSHCSNCNTCIETFDHHCPWVNNCIGRRNYRHFFFFLVFLTIHMLSVFVWSILFVLDHREDLRQTSSIVALGLICLIGLLIIPIFGLTVFHIYLVARGRTTNEQVTGKYSGLYNPFSGGCAHNFCLILCGPRYPKRKAIRHYHRHSRGSNRGGVYYRAEDVKIFTDKDPQTKSINTLLNSPKTYNRDHQHYQPPHSGGGPRQGSIHSTSSKPSSTAGSKRVTTATKTTASHHSPPPSSSAPGPSGGVVIYYSPATSSVSQVTTACDPPNETSSDCTKEGKIDVVTPRPSLNGSDLKLVEQKGEKEDGGNNKEALAQLHQSSTRANKIMSDSRTNSPSPSSSSSASTVIHQPIICNQETATTTTMIIKSTTTSSMTSVTNQSSSESISVTPTTRVTGFKKYEISV